MLFLVIIGYLVLGILEIPPLIKKQQTKELVLYSVFFTLAFVLSILLVLGVNLPSPAKMLERVVTTFLGVKA